MIQIIPGMSGAEVRAALNTLRKEYDIREAGCYVDGSHDDTANFQATINECASNGGGDIKIPNTGYDCIIDGALQRDVDGIDYKGQLYIPYKDWTDIGRYSIRIIGEGIPHFTQTGGLNVASAKSPNTGSRIRSTLINDVEDAFVIASIGDEGTYGHFNYNQLAIENLSIRLTPNASSEITIGGLGLKDSSNNLIRRVTIAPFNMEGNDSALPINNSTGISLAAAGGDNMNVVEQSTVCCFVNGYYMGDHSMIHDSQAICTLNAYLFGYSKLIAIGTRIEALWCANSIKIIEEGVRSILVDCLNVENTADGFWYDKVAHIVDSSNLGRGEVHYDLNEDVRPGFVKVGGTGIMCSPVAVGKVTSGTDAGAANFTISGARDESEGALKDLITKLCTKFGFIDSTTAS